MSFRLKAILAVAALEVAALSGLVAAHAWHLRDSNASRIAERAEETASLIADSVADAVISLDLAAVDSIVANAAGGADLLRVRVRAPDGALLASAGPVAGDAPTEGAVAAVAPLQAGGMDFGEVDILLSTAAIEADLAASLRWIVGVAGLEIVAVAVLSWLLGGVLVRQLQDLREGAERVGAGQAGVTLPVRSADELGRTAAAFNLMSARLARTQAALAERTRELAAEKARAEAAYDAAQARTAAEVQAAQAETARNSFIAAISHELRTPLNGVIGMCELLKTADAAETRATAVETIEGSGRQLLGLVNDLLHLAGQDETLEDPAPFCARTLARQSAAAFARAAAAKGLRLEVEAPRGDWMVEGCAGKLRRALDCLVANAVKFTAEGAVRVTPEIVEGADGPRLRIAVADSGRGVPEAQRERIFERFAQASPDDHAAHGGAGLGLSVARDLVRGMGGDVTLAPGADRGATFVIDVPAPRADAALPPAPAQPDAPPEPADLSTRDVLVVEDNASNVLVITSLLKRLGVGAVTVASNGAEAEALVAGRAFDFVFMDCQMPVMDGYEATRRIRAIEAREGRPATPIAALTASAQAGERERCLAAGMDDFLTKPVQSATLADALRRWPPPVAGRAVA